MKRKLLLSLALFSLLMNAQNMPFITKVYDYMPAPGQYINMSPKYNSGEPRDSVIARAGRALCGRITIEEGTELPDGTITPPDTTINVKPGLISLGAYGGYVVFGFDHPVVNVKGEYDLQIFGNAFQAASSTSAGGSSEPGIVMVSCDINGNGEPDDPWYELAGSEYNNARTQKDFKIVYYKPATATENIRWTCNSVDSLQEGYVLRNNFHSQNYWPEWIEDDSITFEGAKLPCNAVDEGTNGSHYWVQHFYDWGYVDNRSDWGYGYFNCDSSMIETMNMGFKIDWAVDANGNSVELKKIDFVKVYNGILQDCGWLGETSTEVCGAVDLHPDAVAEQITGDVNCDGSVNSSDVTALYNYILNGDSTFMSTSDINGDGSVNSSDVTAIYNIILGY